MRYALFVALLLSPGWPCFGQSATESPKSFREANAAWMKTHPYPTADASDSQREQFYSAMATASEQWIRQWPDETGAWSARFTALSSLKSTPDEEVGKAGEDLLRVSKEHPSGGVLVFPHEAIIASVWDERGMRLQQCVELAKQALAAVDTAEAANPSMAKFRAVMFAQSRALALRVEADAARKLKDYTTADDAVAGLKRDADANDDSSVRSEYLASAAHVAEAEGHNADALMYWKTRTGRRRAAHGKTQSEVFETRSPLCKKRSPSFHPIGLTTPLRHQNRRPSTSCCTE